ncbi:MAG TPA: hypothetical protein DCY46_05400 [Lactobacillus sp.]|nr:hypothetical protein [Lactobacillus sp.]
MIDVVIRESVGADLHRNDPSGIASVHKLADGFGTAQIHWPLQFSEDRSADGIGQNRGAGAFTAGPDGLLGSG